jgi:tellurite resistance-related uncharacterized protein
VERQITGFHIDEVGDWVAELSCGHDQHMRHRPPFQVRPWVLTTDGRSGRLGSPIDCPLCDRAEFPLGLRLLESSPEWDELSVPPGLLRAHRIPARRWGRLEVRHGRLGFTAATRPVIDAVLGPNSVQAIPPQVEHHVELLGPVGFSIGFFAIDGRAVGEPPKGGIGLPEHGDPACWSGLICPECGAVLDGGCHRPGCTLMRS